MDTSSSSSSRSALRLVRESLVRQEDSIVFALIERTRYPRNPSVYDPSSSFHGSLLRFLCRETDILRAKVGLYQNADEVPFFPEELPAPLRLPNHLPIQLLHPPAASVNINKKIWNLYIEQLLPLFTADGDDGNYASTAASDLACLQAISRRIHYGKFVAEIKFRDAPEEYAPAIRSQDADALLKTLTFESVEETVKLRVKKKAMIIGQDISLDENMTSGQGSSSKANGKIDPAFVSKLYGDWIIPLTKLVQVEYLLHRLD